MFFHYKSERVVLKIEVPPLSGPRRYVHFGVCEAQSASFALATTRPPDGLLNASRPTTQLRTILYKSTRRSRGRQDAIDFVTIALPSLRSLRHSHRRVPFSTYVTRSRAKTIPTRPFTCTIRQVRHSLGSPPCGSCSVFENVIVRRCSSVAQDCLLDDF